MLWSTLQIKSVVQVCISLLHSFRNEWGKLQPEWEAGVRFLCATGCAGSAQSRAAHQDSARAGTLLLTLYWTLYIWPQYPVVHIRDSTTTCTHISLTHQFPWQIILFVMKETRIIGAYCLGVCRSTSALCCNDSVHSSSRELYRIEIKSLWVSEPMLQ